MDSTNNDWFIIKDLDGFINASRALVFNNFGKNQTQDIDPLALTIDNHNKDELDTVLSFDETKNIVINLLRKQTHKFSKDTRYLINDNLYQKIIAAIGDRMTSNILNSLVNKGLVETAYDADTNDFVFWIKDHENQQPETD